MTEGCFLSIKYSHPSVRLRLPPPLKGRLLLLSLTRRNDEESHPLCSKRRNTRRGHSLHCLKFFSSAILFEKKNITASAISLRSNLTCLRQISFNPLSLRHRLRRCHLPLGKGGFYYCHLRGGTTKNLIRNVLIYKRRFIKLASLYNNRHAQFVRGGA